MRRAAGALAAVVVVAVVLVQAWPGIRFWAGSFRDGAQVPNLIGLSEEHARRVLEADDFRMRVVSRQRCDGGAVVTRQEPVATNYTRSRDVEVELSCP